MSYSLCCSSAFAKIKVLRFRNHQMVLCVDNIFKGRYESRGSEGSFTIAILSLNTWERHGKPGTRVNPFHISSSLT